MFREPERGEGGNYLISNPKPIDDECPIER
jgi:hypothetical protein